MSKVFLGKPIHWLLVFLLVGAGWVAGLDRVHVSQFNPFLIVLLVVTIGLVLIVLRTSPAGEQVTRDPVEEDD
ncbi:MAG: hypothetical protein AAGD13_24690 [Pseudomonadota bacterium]